MTCSDYFWFGMETAAVIMGLAIFVGGFLWP
jgi:hypothetical protein